MQTSIEKIAFYVLRGKCGLSVDHVNSKHWVHQPLMLSSNIAGKNLIKWKPGSIASDSLIVGCVSLVNCYCRCAEFITYFKIFKIRTRNV